MLGEVQETQEVHHPSVGDPREKINCSILYRVPNLSVFLIVERNFYKSGFVLSHMRKRTSVVAPSVEVGSCPPERRKVWLVEGFASPIEEEGIVERTGV